MPRLRAAIRGNVEKSKYVDMAKPLTDAIFNIENVVDAYERYQQKLDAFTAFVRDGTRIESPPLEVVEDVPFEGGENWTDLGSIWTLIILPNHKESEK